MKKFSFSDFLICLLSTVTAVLCCLLLFQNRRSSAISDQVDSNAIAELVQSIRREFYYYDPAVQTSEKMRDDAMRGIVAGLNDPYAEYMTREEFDRLLETESGEYKGLGITVYQPDETGSAILRVYADSPADQAGLQPGDILINVNGTDTALLDMNTFLTLFSKDDEVPDQLTILRDGEEMSFTVLRGEVQAERVLMEKLEPEIGYLRIEEFTGTVAEEFWNTVSAFDAAGVRKLVIDLRDNPGGGLAEILNVASFLVPEGSLITKIQSRNGLEEVYYSEGKDRISGWDIVVLINGETASAAELMAGSLKAYGLAEIIGTRSFGKGIVQKYFRMNTTGGWLKVTTDCYFTPDGICIQGTGIEPNQTVELSKESATIPLDLLPHEQDEQLQAALGFLRGEQTPNIHAVGEDTL